ncbi:MAG TPA: RDD family protein [Myxococcaceae bacterium]|nr:RDD family protein [Myxococcaceae bacterium]
MTPRYGGVVSRGLALVVDTLVLTLLLAGTTWIVPQLAQHLLGIPSDPARCGSTTDWWRIRAHLCQALGWVTPVAAVLYPPLYRVGFWTVTGRTPGMALLGLRLLRTDGRPVGLATAIRRWALRLGSILALGLGFLPILFSARRQALHDRLAGTVVVHDWATEAWEPRAAPGALIATGSDAPSRPSEGE